MNSKKKFFLIFLFILFDAFLLVGFLVIRDATMSDKFEKEMNVISKLSITEDRFNRRIRTSGDYGVVEKSIKEYLDDYAVLLQNVLSVLQDEKLVNILSYDNYRDDGFEFKKSLSYLKSSKDDFNKDIDKLSFASKEENIISYVDDKISDPYFKNLYVEIILSEERKKEFNDIDIMLEGLKIKVNNVFDVSIEVLELLKENKDSWLLENGEIKFKDKSLYNQYNDYISKIEKK